MVRGSRMPSMAGEPDRSSTPAPKDTAPNPVAPIAAGGISVWALIAGMRSASSVRNRFSLSTDLGGFNSASCLAFSSDIATDTLLNPLSYSGRYPLECNLKRLYRHRARVGLQVRRAPFHGERVEQVPTLHHMIAQRAVDHN